MRRQPQSLVLTQLCPEARHRTRRLELGLDAVDDRKILSALSRSACSTTCCLSLSEPLNQMISSAPSTKKVFVLLIVPSRYFCGGSFCFVSWCVKFFLCCWRLMCVFIFLVKLR